MEVQIPNKSHFTMNEVCSLTQVKPYVLRFWETEFEEISPEAHESGQKLFRHSDIEAIFAIKKLLFEDKLKIEEAKLKLFQIKQFETSENGNDSEIEEVEDLSIPKLSQSLSTDDIEKLVMAKRSLEKVLGQVNSIIN